MGLADLDDRPGADRDRRKRQQRLQGDAGAVGRYPGRLAGRGHLARRRQRVASDLHDHDPCDRSPLHTDARPAISNRDRLAERRLQPTAAPELLPGRQDEATAASSHHDAGSAAIGPLLRRFVDLATCPPKRKRAGGSRATAGCGVLRDRRGFFPPHRSYMHAGIRKSRTFRPILGRYARCWC